MNKLKVVKLESEQIVFDNGIILNSYHDQDCCESHYLWFNDLTLEDFEGLEFDLSNDNFFKRVEGYGIELIPINGFPIRIPAYADNNGYYSDNLILRISDSLGFYKGYDITECQIWQY
jgi:hypothetical protein